MAPFLFGPIQASGFVSGCISPVTEPSGAVEGNSGRILGSYPVGHAKSDQQWLKIKEGSGRCGESNRREHQALPHRKQKTVNKIREVSKIREQTTWLIMWLQIFYYKSRCPIYTHSPSMQPKCSSDLNRQHSSPSFFKMAVKVSLWENGVAVKSWEDWLPKREWYFREIVTLLTACLCQAVKSHRPQALVFLACRAWVRVLLVMALKQDTLPSMLSPLDGT